MNKKLIFFLSKSYVFTQQILLASKWFRPMSPKKQLVLGKILIRHGISRILPNDRHNCELDNCSILESMCVYTRM